jgi:hypothetical protein
MLDSLPPIHIVIAESPLTVLNALAAAARGIESFNVELIERPPIAPELSVVNIRYEGATRHEGRGLHFSAFDDELTHEGLGLQFIAFDDEPSRISVEIRAARWDPADPPSYATYVRAAKLLTSPVLKNYQAVTGKALRIRIPTLQDISLKLPPVAKKLFNRFAGAANTSSLHPNDWKRLYDFIRMSRFRPLSESEMTQLLVEHKFQTKQARRIAEIYVHLCEFKCAR